MKDWIDGIVLRAPEPEDLENMLLFENDRNLWPDSNATGPYSRYQLTKYLSEVSRNVSGYAANFWINRYTALDIARQLRDKSLTLTDIAYRFGFSSPAHFSRYVQQHLGMPPSVFRKNSGA